MVFGRRSERYVEDPGQQHFAFPDDDGGLAAEQMAAALAQANAIIEEYLVRRRRKQDGKKPPEGSQKLPEHLERREFLVDVPPSEQSCETHGPRVLVGKDIVEVLELDRPKLWVKVLIYLKYGCVDHSECGLKMPERVIAGMIPGGKYAPSIAAEVVVNKYIRHLPLYRQQDLYAGLGWAPSRSTLCGITETTASLLEPLARRYAELVRQDPVLGTDDTRALLLRLGEDPGSQQAYFWLYRGCTTAPYNVYDFTTNREQTGPQEFLKNYRGTFVADCYAGYVNVDSWSKGQVVHAGCWGHARRKVFDARESSPIEAAVLLAMLQELYDVEERGQGLNPGARRELRQSAAKPVMQRMKAWLDSPASRLLPKLALTEAVNYIRNHWDALQVYLNNGAVPIDNNDTERDLRMIGLGRKNWLFIGSEEAGPRAAILMTVLHTAHRHNLDEVEYLRDILTRLSQGDTDYESMLADRWKAAHPEAVRKFREEERRDKADRKQFRRAKRRAAKSRGKPAAKTKSGARLNR
jgi:transposase